MSDHYQQLMPKEFYTMSGHSQPMPEEAHTVSGHCQQPGFCSMPSTVADLLESSVLPQHERVHGPDDPPTESERPRWLRCTACAAPLMSLFARSNQLDGFVVEKVLGRGAYGVVVLVRQRLGADLYAMKLMNTAENLDTKCSVLPSRAQTAARERDILKRLQHPFIIRMGRSFEVPDRICKDTATRTVVSDYLGNSRFHRAIVMQYCPRGDLNDYVYSLALPASTRAVAGRQLSDEEVEYLSTMRRFAAEMCIALKFLHGHLITHRDIKPQNVLLRESERKELHICLTDFGCAKQMNGPMLSQLSATGNVMNSLAGTVAFAAPEVMRIMEYRQRQEYTPAVDLYSLGKTLALMLWRTKFGHGRSKSLVVPDRQEFNDDPRVPQCASRLIDTLTQALPAARGSADQLASHSFFAKCHLRDRWTLPALDFAAMERRAMQ